jgi:hypothetical protein
MSWQRWSGIMKCYPFEEKRLAKWSPPFIVQPKYDGDRCKAYPLPHSNDFLCLTSEENPYFSIPHIKESLASSGLNLVLDGELYSHYLCIEGGHELVHSIASRTKNLHPRHKELEYHIFDVEVEKLQLERILILENIKKLNLPYIRVAPFWICETLDDIKRVYDNLVTQGYEGIIIRHAICPYERKRSTLMMKFKPKRSDTYNIVGWNEEVSQHGIPKGRIGSLTLSSQTGDTFSVSAGLNDESRAKLWALRDQLSGHSATVHYQHLTNKKIPKGTFDIKIPSLLED